MITLWKTHIFFYSSRLVGVIGLHVGYTWRNLSYSSLKSTYMTMFVAVQFTVTIEWEWKVGYKPSYSQEKLVSYGLHTVFYLPRFYTFIVWLMGAKGKDAKTYEFYEELLTLFITPDY